MKRVPVLVGLGLLASGCVTRTEFLRRDSEMRRLVMDTQARLSQVQREVDRLRGEVETTGRRGHSSEAAQARAAQAAEARREAESAGRTATLNDPRDVVENTTEPSATGSTTTPAPATPIYSSGGTVTPTTQAVAAVTTSTVPPPPKLEVPEEWSREVAQEQAVSAAINVPEKADFQAAMDTVSKRECGRAIDQLNGFVSKHKDSALADNALYWTARCYLVRGDQNQAISKFYEVGTKYPKGDRTPAALLAQANLFLGMGNTPDARIVLSRLTSYYPNSEEAATARKKLAELQR